MHSSATDNDEEYEENEYDQNTNEEHNNRTDGKDSPRGNTSLNFSGGFFGCK